MAALDNEAGVAGVAPQVYLYAVKVLDANGAGSFSDIIKGIEWCVHYDVQVINLSLTSLRGNESLRQAVQVAYKAGITVVAAAGNTGGAVTFPAAYPETLAISASNSQDQMAGWSNRGPEIDFISPGVSVPSTFLGGGYRTASGTSMAAPHVTGLVALKLFQNGSLGPEGIRQVLEAAAEPLPGLSKEEQGAGLVNAAKLVGAKEEVAGASRL